MDRMRRKPNCRNSFSIPEEKEKKQKGNSNPASRGSSILNSTSWMDYLPSEDCLNASDDDDSVTFLQCDNKLMDSECRGLESYSDESEEIETERTAECRGLESYSDESEEIETERTAGKSPYAYSDDIACTVDARKNWANEISDEPVGARTSLATPTPTNATFVKKGKTAFTYSDDTACSMNGRANWENEGSGNSVRNWKSLATSTPINADVLERGKTAYAYSDDAASTVNGRTNWENESSGNSIRNWKSLATSTPIHDAVLERGKGSVKKYCEMPEVELFDSPPLAISMPMHQLVTPQKGLNTSSLIDPESPVNVTQIPASVPSCSKDLTLQPVGPVDFTDVAHISGKKYPRVVNIFSSFLNSLEVEDDGRIGERYKTDKSFDLMNKELIEDAHIGISELLSPDVSSNYPEDMPICDIACLITGKNSIVTTKLQKTKRRNKRNSLLDYSQVPICDLARFWNEKNKSPKKRKKKGS